MTPKSLLRHPQAQSLFNEIETTTSFKPLYSDDEIKNPELIKKILICSGKIYYDLVNERKTRQLNDEIAIVRVEQICPFPYHLIAKEISRFPTAKASECCK